jgi:DNA repair protein RecN (Recombination protein N)
LIDAHGGLSAHLADVRRSYSDLRKAAAEFDSERTRLEKARADADYLRHAHEELSKLAAKAGEETTLAERRAAMMQAEKVSAELRDAYDALAGDGAPIATLSSVLRRLERRQAQAPQLVAPSVQALDAALTALDQAGQVLDQALRDADYDPRELERIEERLFALRAASRKYGAGVDALAAVADKIAGDLASLDAGEARLARLAKAVAAAQSAYDGAAKALSAARRKAANGLEAAVNAELAPLKLEGARFIVQFRAEPKAAGPDGIDQIEFWVQTNPGTRPGPLMKVASGGELARFMLALKVVLVDRGSAPTLIFDEIDTGVGGAVADAIGERLARLAARVQVLAVTHAPQVAAKAASHLRIAKSTADKGKRVATRVSNLEQAARREEIARMLAGATITEEARAAASRLMEGAG